MSKQDDTQLEKHQFLMESECGAQSVLVGVVDQKPFMTLRVLEATPLSGTAWDVSPQQMFRALKLHVWAEENHHIFIDGRVSP